MEENHLEKQGYVDVSLWAGKIGITRKEALRIVKKKNLKIARIGNFLFCSKTDLDTNLLLEINDSMNKRIEKINLLKKSALEKKETMNSFGKINKIKEIYNVNFETAQHWFLNSHFNVNLPDTVKSEKIFFDELKPEVKKEIEMKAFNYDYKLPS